MIFLLFYSFMSVCNLNCICVDCDCKFYHSYHIKDRRIIRNIFDKFNNPDKNEPNPLSRRANCKFGQLCHNENCGFRHRLSFNSRIKLLDAYNDFKFQSTKIEKKPKIIKQEFFNIPNSNKFNLLDINHDTPIVINPIQTKSWADIVSDNDDFYMKFD